MLKGKRVLITAGPTWVALDRVRVISNTATAETGFLLAQKLRDSGARVTLLLGPVHQGRLWHSGIRVLRFKFFDELKSRLIGELRSARYDILIHSAAVSDYRPRRVSKAKTPSGRRSWRLDLMPTPKIIDIAKRLYPSLEYVAFKYEPCFGRGRLLKQARALLLRVPCDLVVANTLIGSKYRAYILKGDMVSGAISNKKDLVDRLVGYL